MTDFELSFDADEQDMLFEAANAEIQDIDDDFCPPDGRGWRTRDWLSQDFYLVLDWDKFTGAGLLEEDDGYLRITDLGRQTVALLKDNRR